MKRIAIFISGHPRHINAFNVSMKSFVFNFDHQIDYFTHFWGEYSQEAIDTIKPKKYLFETPIDFNPFITQLKTENRRLSKYRPLSDFISQFYSVKKACELKSDYEKENNFTYDLVIKARYDVFFLCTMNFVIENFDSYGELLHTHNNLRFDLRARDGKNFGTGDILAFSSSKNMNLYSKTFDFIPECFDSEENNPLLLSNSQYGPESMLGYNIFKNKLNVKEHLLPFILYRGNYFKISENLRYYINTFCPSEITF